MPSEYLQVMTATDSEDAARRLADSVVEARLAACVQVVGPIASTYWWKGVVERAEEWLCLMKTASHLFEALAGHIKANHSYETPEITAVPITHGSQEYLDWISSETARAS